MNELDEPNFCTINFKATFDRYFFVAFNLCSSVRKSDENFENSPRLRNAGFLLQLQHTTQD